MQSYSGTWMTGSAVLGLWKKGHFRRDCQHFRNPRDMQPHNQGFWYFARSLSPKFPRNSLEILSNTCRHTIFESYLGCWGCLLAVNLLIYLETLSPQRANNIPKLPGVLRLMLWKTGKQQCKNPVIPSVDRGNWGWERNSLFYMLALHEECCVLYMWKFYYDQKSILRFLCISKLCNWTTQSYQSFKPSFQKDTCLFWLKSS